MEQVPPCRHPSSLLVPYPPLVLWQHEDKEPEPEAYTPEARPNDNPQASQETPILFKDLDKMIEERLAAALKAKNAKGKEKENDGEPE